MARSPAHHAGALLSEAMLAGMPRWHRIAPTLLYCVRTLVATALALYVAFALQLQSPSSAAITVLIVANPVSGALISKSLWRLAGTAVGATVAVLLMAAFAQAPMLFILMFSLCIGIACLIATLLRYFKAYGAVLGGYTIIIVCAPAFGDPQGVFTSALSRVSAVSVGIVAAALVFLLSEVPPPSRLTEASLRLIRNTGAALAGHGAWPASGAPGRALGLAHGRAHTLDGTFHERRAALLVQANLLQEVIEYAAADSYVVHRRSHHLRLGVAGIMGTLSALHPLRPRTDGDDELGQDQANRMHAAIASLEAMTTDTVTPTLTRLATVRHEILAAREIRDLPPAHARAIDLLGRLHDAIASLQNATPVHTGRRRRLRLFLDWPTAWRNAARGFLVSFLACLFWYVTRWPAGPTLLAYLVPAACLLSTNPSASRASVDFATGTLLAIPASYVCSTLLLPQVEGFPLLIAALSICLLPGIWLQFNPRHGLRAFGYVVFFSAMISVRNPVHYDDVGLVNNWLAYLLGTASLVVVFRALLPANPLRDSDRLVHGIVRATERIARRRRLPDMASWEFLQMQRALRLSQRLQQAQMLQRTSGADYQRVTDQALAAIELGRDLAHLPSLLDRTELEPADRLACREAFAALGRMRRAPALAARSADRAAEILRRSDTSTSLAAAARLAGIAALIDGITDVLADDFSVLHAASEPHAQALCVQVPHAQ